MAPDRIAKLRPGVAGKPYLRDPEVVHGVLKEMLNTAIEDPQGAEATAKKVTAIVTGKDPAYAPRGSWNTEDGIGNWIKGEHERRPGQGGL